MAEVEIYWNKDGGSYSLIATYDADVTYTDVDADLFGGIGSYGFYSISTDQVGNREETPTSPPDDVVTYTGSGIDDWMFY